jgi:hypothetical protein
MDKLSVDHESFGGTYICMRERAVCGAAQLCVHHKVRTCLLQAAALMYVCVTCLSKAAASTQNTHATSCVGAFTTRSLPP